MTWGTGGFGTTTPWGGSAAAISIARAWATSTRTILVETSAAARAVDPFDAGDALNPRTWIVTRLDAMVNLTPIFVQPASGDSVFTVTTLEEFGSNAVLHRIGSTTLKGANGVLITAPYQATFSGVVVAANAVAAARRRPLVRDLANPVRSNPNTSEVVSSVIVTGGDYATEEDVAVVRKGMIRRITTPRGSIRHLKDYGVGFEVKSLVPQGGNRDALRVEIERQCIQEPGVRKVRAALDVFAGGVVLIRVRARMVAAQLEIALQRNSNGSFQEA